jgi:hypothetical protein
MKRPAIQFYPGDWRKDPGVQALDFHDRGVWFEIICLMHESEERGVLILNGKPMPDEALARLLGLDNQTLKQTISRLLDYGVASRRDEDGALICRRMVRDEKLSEIRREAGKKGGNPSLLNQNTKQNQTTGVNQNPTPSSSSSSSVNTTAGPSTPNTAQAKKRNASGEYPPEFDAAWSAYPKRAGDNPKRRALNAWKARVEEGHAPEAILAGVERYATFCEATGKVGTEMVKQAATFFGPDLAFTEDWKPPVQGRNGNGESQEAYPRLRVSL